MEIYLTVQERKYFKYFKLATLKVCKEKNWSNNCWKEKDWSVIMCYLSQLVKRSNIFKKVLIQADTKSDMSKERM